MAGTDLSMSLSAIATRRLEETLLAITDLRKQVEPLGTVMGIVVDTLRSGGTVFTAGNGGSAASALQLSQQIVGRYRDERPAHRAVCLNADPVAMTCIANDYGFDQVFARQCEALVSEGDLLVAMSTSGNSRNIIEALRTAQQRGAATVGLLGQGGGRSAQLCAHCITVPSDDAAHVLEAHAVIIHLLCEAVDAMKDR